LGTNGLGTRNKTIGDISEESGLHGFIMGRREAKDIGGSHLEEGI